MFVAFAVWLPGCRIMLLLETNYEHQFIFVINRQLRVQKQVACLIFFLWISFCLKRFIGYICVHKTA
jgi:hypothetical protein